MAKKKTTKKSKPKAKKARKAIIKKVKKVKITGTIDNTEIEEEKSSDKNDSYEEHGCEYLNEAECEEELEEDNLDLDEVEKEHFGDGKEE